LVVHLAGDKTPWCLVPTALELSAAQVVEAWAARFRQEEGFRDHKQRLGMEEGRAWTKAPILRRFQVQLVALTLVRLLPARLDPGWGAGTWGCKPPWHARQRHASILDLRRLFWRYRMEFVQCLVALEELANIPPTPGQCRRAAARAA
jgi:hypothetical protein